MKINNINDILEIFCRDQILKNPVYEKIKKKKQKTN